MVFYVGPLSKTHRVLDVCTRVSEPRIRQRWESLKFVAMTVSVIRGREGGGRREQGNEGSS